MNCLQCKKDMMIDEWNGWYWFCAFCDIYGRKATQKEIETWEKQLEAQEAKNDD